MAIGLVCLGILQPSIYSFALRTTTHSLRGRIFPSSLSSRYIGVMTHHITRGVDSQSASGAISDASSLNQPLYVISLDKVVRLHASILTSR